MAGNVNEGVLSISINFARRTFGVMLYYCKKC